MRWMLLLALCACGGSTTPNVGGCWNYFLDGAAAGELNLSLIGRQIGGDFTLPPATGNVYGTMEPNGNVALLLYTPEKLILDVSIPAFTEPLAGVATDHSASLSHAFLATRCH